VVQVDEHDVGAAGDSRVHRYSRASAGRVWQ
jgi:hypothetical protein